MRQSSRHRPDTKGNFVDGGWGGGEQMAEPVRSTRRRWFYAIAVAVLLASGAFLYLAADPLNSVERSLVGDRRAAARFPY